MLAEPQTRDYFILHLPVLEAENMTLQCLQVPVLIVEKYNFYLLII
jgi:hypothetical protein